MKIAVLDAATLGDDLSLAPLDVFGTVTVYGTTAPGEMDERVREADALIVNKIKCNATTLREAHALKLICVFATGYDNIDLAFCRERGIAVCNVVGYSTDSVAQVTLSMALSLATRLPSYDAYTKSGAYASGTAANAVSPVYHELRGKTWGIFGYGNIGKRVAAVANALGCRVLVCKQTPTREDFPVVSFEELCRRSDILSLHTPLNEKTRGILDREHIAMLPKGAILINVARGAVVDEEAVTDAVLDGSLGGFGCDVYTAEPFSPNHPYSRLYPCQNVILTPHMAWGAYEARTRCLDEICKNIAAFLKGEERNRVDLMK